MSTLEIARGYLAAGLGVIPIRPWRDGHDKEPDLPGGHPYLRELPTDSDLVRWFTNGRNGIAIPCGAVSGHLETLDVETEDAYDFFQRAVHLREPGLIDRLSWSLTPGHLDGSHGLHARYRCPGPSLRHQDLAVIGQIDKAGQHALDPRGRPLWRVLIETRGEGQYAIAPGTPGHCHKTGRTWEPANNVPITALPTLTPQERETLLVCARMLDERGDHVEVQKEPRVPPSDGSARPGDLFNLRGSWEEVLEPAGWQKWRSRGETTYWTRPGKAQGVSASTDVRSRSGKDLLFVFSSSTELHAWRAYTKFGAWALLHHNGDHSAAARDLAEKGYRDPGAKRSADSHRRETPEPAKTPPKPEKSPEPIVIHLSNVQPEALRWLWPQWLGQGMLAVLDGDPGLGKSTLTLDLAARITRGLVMPPGQERDLGREPGGVLLVGAEDPLRYVVRPRLDAAGADSDRIWSFEGIRAGDGEERNVVLPKDLHLMAEFIRSKGVRLVIVDPLMAFLAADCDAHKDQDVRRCLRPLSKLADSLDIVILLLRHLNKLSGGPALYRGGSSIGITGSARTSLIVGRDPEADDRYILCMNKTNIGPRPTALAYHIEGAGYTSRIVWEGECGLYPDQILGHGGSEDRLGGLDLARAWLKEILAKGALPAADALRAGAQTPATANEPWKGPKPGSRSSPIGLSRSGSGASLVLSQKEARQTVWRVNWLSCLIRLAEMANYLTERTVNRQARRTPRHTVWRASFCDRAFPDSPKSKDEG